MNKRKQYRGTNKVYLVFIHKVDENLLYGGYFSSAYKAKSVCDRWNEKYGNDKQFADFINVTEEKNNEFILDGITTDGESNF